MVIQRVTSARVLVGEETTGAVADGVLVLLGVLRGDTEADAERLAERVVRFRIFRDEEGRMNRSAVECGAAVLVVSQFTLAADLSRGNRPGFSAAAAPAEAEALYEDFCSALASHGVAVEQGRFGADMAVSLVNDGPVTIWIDTAA